VGGVDLAAAPAEQKQAPQHREQLRRVADPLAQLLGARVCALDLGRPAAVERHERAAERDLQADLRFRALGRLRFGRQKPDRGREVLHGFAGRAALHRHLGDPAKVTDRAVRVTAARKVAAQQARDLVGSLAEAGLKSLADAAMQLRPSPRGDTFVDHVLVERVTERVSSGERPVRPRIGAERSQERAAPGQLGARLLHVVERQSRGRSHDGRGEVDACGARRFQHAPRLGRDAIECMPDQPPQIVGDVEGNEVGLDRDPRPDQVIDDAGEKQRIAAGAPVERRASASTPAASGTRRPR